MGTVKRLSMLELDRIRPKMWAGKLQIGSRKDNDIGSQVLRTAAMVEKKETTDMRPASAAERFSLWVLSRFGSRNGGRETDNNLWSHKIAKCF